MVKDEAEVIGRCLSSMMPLCDSILVVDTGSTDNTLECVEQTLRDFPSYRIEHVPFTTYGAVRNQLIKIASEMADWVLLMDADMTIRGRFVPPAEAAIGLVEFLCDGLVSRRAMFVRSTIPWHYEGELLHEFITSATPHTSDKIAGVKAEHHGPAGDKRSPAEDLVTLQRIYAENPGNPRWLFYVAQTLKVLERKDEAVAAYRKCANMGDLKSEWVWYSLFQAATLMADVEELVTVWKLRPLRVEPLYGGACILIDLHRYSEALELLLAALQISEPDDSLFVNRPVYQWGVKLELSNLLASIGKFGDARLINASLLSIPDLPDNVRTEIVANEDSYPVAQ